MKSQALFQYRTGLLKTSKYTKRSPTDNLHLFVEFPVVRREQKLGVLSLQAVENSQSLMPFAFTGEQVSFIKVQVEMDLRPWGYASSQRKLPPCFLESAQDY
jgi:hypothetical protein